ncbi:MAG: hypothetical protein GY832_14335, partial [Chloroflexi bacterium]|nr:hypothetical protein [Chloroflexota bacterium]
MNAFTAHRLRFVAEVQTTIELDEHQGSAIRGAFLSALRNRFCIHRTATECAACPLGTTCPVAALVSTLRPSNGRGRDVPRPFTVQPPLPGACEHPVDGKRGRTFFRYLPGERFEFGLTLYARALEFFSHVTLALEEFACAGIGHKLKRADGRWRPGTLSVQEVWAENSLTGDRQPVMQANGQMIQVPDIPITHQQVCEWAGSHHGSRLALRFLTPTRLI